MLLKISFHWDGPQAPWENDSIDLGLMLHCGEHNNRSTHPALLTSIRLLNKAHSEDVSSLLQNRTQGPRSGQITMNSIMTDTQVNSSGQKDNLIHASTRDQPD